MIKDRKLCNIEGIYRYHHIFKDFADISYVGYNKGS